MTAIIDSYNDTQALVIAGNYSEYLNWRKENPSIRYCTYVERVEDLRGINGFLAKVILYGNYENNPVYHTKQMRKLLAENKSPFHSYVN
ncbi:hypothetical protein [Pseudanabaena sp. Chao 1811]|uniref:hypothetical protein n=1 Tax=Pseudanabaena sp. Chao 1811 TaxID=2963092 RepID=UPI0022F3989C|nr:hypothetical protein [Pseudanabaena sp. Chao 1811]